MYIPQDRITENQLILTVALSLLFNLDIAENGLEKPGYNEILLHGMDCHLDQWF